MRTFLSSFRAFPASFLAFPFEGGMLSTGMAKDVLQQQSEGHLQLLFIV